MGFRTDLAVENFAEFQSGDNGIRRRCRGKFFSITEIILEDDRHLSSLGKGTGTYITLECGEEISRFSEDSEDLSEELADELRKLVPEGEILVAGLGNTEITADALGPKTASEILATRHFQREIGAEDEFLSSLRKVSVIAGGVLGQTGIESAELIQALVREIRPQAVIAVDALACSDINRLGRTIQISDAGISPGSGVNNARKELSQRILGIPVIAVGVPTVVDMHTIAENLTGKKASPKLPNMTVAPRDADLLTKRAARLLGISLNLALQPKMRFEDVIFF